MSFQHVISVSDLKTYLNDPNWVIFDCRYSIQEPELGYQEYLEEHISGAIYVGLEKDLSGRIVPGETGRHPLPEVPDIVEKLSSWGVNQDSQVVIYDHNSAAFAARFWWILNWLGHDQVAVLDGGWEAWVNGQGSVEAQETNCKSGKFIPAVREDLAVNVQYVDSIRLDPDFLLLDARAPERYDGTEETIDPVAGHIPGAVSAPYHDNLTKDGLFKPEAELKDRFAQILGEYTPATTIFYCGSGVTAIHNIIALRRAGYGMARLYPGSWSEWITDTSRPIEV